MMDMMQLLEMLKAQTAKNKPLMPNANPYDFASSPFPSSPQGNGLPPRSRSDLGAPAPAPAPAPQGPMDLMGPVEQAGPPVHLAGELGIGPDQQMGPSKAEMLGEVSVPDREKKSGLIKKPFHKDNDRMAMMLAAMSDGFGGMTLRGKTGMGAVNKLTMANAQQNMKNNKTMDYLVQNNPAMAKKMLSLPPEMRDKYMDLAMKSSFAGAGDEEDTADIRNYEYFNSLDKDQQKQFLGLKRGDRYVTNPDGSSKVIYSDGTERWITTSEDALRMKRSGADAVKGGEAAGEEFRGMFKTARYAQDNLDGLQRTREKLVASPDGGGIFQPYKLFFDRVKAEFGDIDGAARATNEQLLEMEGVERTMQWFLSSGLGARGLDTPAEFMQWLKLNGGDLTMTRDASIAFIDRAMDRTMRDADRYNAAISDPLYSDVDKIDRYKPVEYGDPRLKSQTQESQPSQSVSDGTTRVIDGVTYVYRNGQWYQQ